MTKAEIRKLYKEKRKGLSEEEIKEWSSEIQHAFLNYLSQNPQIHHVHVFLPIQKLKEVNTLPLVQQLLDSNYSLYTSKISVDGEMKTIPLKSLDGLIEDSWGIPTLNDEVELLPEKIQLVVMPLLAYDHQGFRIGYGKGFYDNFIKSLGQKVLKVGFSFFPPFEKLPIEPHDEQMNMCITPKKTYFFD
jgi:5-formyltetrahydrofolate cyclo-ligase